MTINQNRDVIPTFIGFKITIVVMGAIGMIVWGCAIGFQMGYCMFDAYTQILALISIIVNGLYIFYTSRIILCITSTSFPSPVDFRDVRAYSSKLLAAFVIGFAAWINAIVCFVLYDYDYSYWVGQEFNVLFGCSFSYMWATIIFGLSIGYEGKVSRLFFRMSRDVEEEMTGSLYLGRDGVRSVYNNRDNRHARPGRNANTVPAVYGHSSPWIGEL